MSLQNHLAQAEATVVLQYHSQKATATNSPNVGRKAGIEILYQERLSDER